MKRGGSLKDRRNQQNKSVGIYFCRAFHGGSSEKKKIKILSFVCAEIFTELTIFFFTKI